MKQNADETLDELDVSLQRMESLLAWQELKRGESQRGSINIPPQFGSVSADLKIEAGHFWKMAIELKEQIATSAKNGSGAAQIRFQKLIARYHRLPRA